MKLKGFIATTVVFVMLMAILPITYAGTFPDVTERHAWAAQYIEDMVSRGMLKGYPDGSFKPDKSISKLESLILAARILGFTNPDNQKYIETATKVFANDLSLYDIEYKSEVSYLLYWNVLKISELPSYLADSVKGVPLKRYEAAILLTKVMGAEKVALDNTMIILDFADDSTIPASSKAYIDYVNTKKIMNGVEDNKFAPQGEVTRAMMATMMQRVEKAMNITIIEATVVSASSSASTITATVTNETDSSTFTIAPDTIIKLDGLDASLVSLIAGVKIRLYTQDSKIRFVEAIASDLQFATEGVIQSTSTNNGARIISITPTLSTSDEAKQYTLSDGCAITTDGVPSLFNALSKGVYVKLQIKSGKVESVVAETKEKTFRGVVDSLSFDTGEGGLTLKLTDGTLQSFKFATDVTIIRNGKQDEVRQIGAGDTAELTVQYGRIKKFAGTSINKSTDGTIEEIIISSSPKLTIKEGGISKTYSITPTTKFIVDDATDSTIYSLRLGATATLDLQSENITSIKTKTVVIPPQLVGTVSYIHPTGNVMGIDVVNPTTGAVTTTQAIVKSNAKIMDNTASKITQFKQITKGRTVVVIGTVNYGVFEINTIIITL